MNNLKESLLQCQEELKMLGFFDRSKKKEYTAKIENLELQISGLESKLQKISSDMKNINVLKTGGNLVECRICGYVHVGYTVPEKCPICLADCFGAKSASTVSNSYTSSTSADYSNSSSSDFGTIWGMSHEEWNRMNDDLDAVQSYIAQEHCSDYFKDV